ncbi:MAG: YegS/Rv2252/BmrU family lipid kinase [Treponema sp.]|nr:YegS/Rv2252/BmrU family lipid kinase [Treponema sp.]
MYYFIVNVHGGSGKSFILWNKIKKILKKRNVEFENFVPQRVGHAAELAKKIADIDERDKKIVILGGDGTLNEVLNGIPEEKFSSIKLGLIPSGSGNDFSRGMNLPRHNYKKALDLILNSKGDKKIDLGIIKSDDEGALFKKKIFAISSGFGLNAVIGTSVNKSKIKVVLNKLNLGNLSYAILTVIALFSLKTRNIKIRFDGGEATEYKNVVFVAAMNGYAEGGGIPMTPDAKIDDGKLSVCIVCSKSKLKTFLMFPLLCIGKHNVFKSVFIRDFEKMEIESESPSISHTDGELFGNLSKAEYTVWKNAVTMLV